MRVSKYKTERNKEQGFTLTELLIAITLSSIVFLGLGTIYISTTHLYHRSIENETLASNAQFVIDTMAREIRLSRKIQINGAGTEITCEFDDPSNIKPEVTGRTIIFGKVDDKIFADDGITTEMIAKEVETLLFQKVYDDDNAIKIDLSIKVTDSNFPERTKETSVSTTINLRCSPSTNML